MNKLEFILRAKDQYSIQSPFLFDLYSNVIAPRVDRHSLASLAISNSDLYAQLLFKLSDHYRASAIKLDGWTLDNILQTPQGDLIGLFRQPHHNKTSESQWAHLVNTPCVTLSVDLFHTGLVFTSPKLSKQHWLLR